MEEKKNGKSSNLGIIVLIVAVMLIGIGAGLLIVMPNESGFDDKKSGNNTPTNTGNTNLENVENNNTEPTPLETPVEDPFKDIKVSDSKVQELYKKYHSDVSSVALSGNAIEKDIYEADIYKLTYLNDNGQKLPYYYAIKILDPVMNDMNSNNLVDDNYEKTVYEKIEKEFKSFFGDKINYKKELFSCFEFSANDNVIKYTNNCGDISDTVAEYSITKAEKDDDHIYIYEQVTIKNDSNGSSNRYTYRWNYEKQDDGNYYFLYAERA